MFPVVQAHIADVLWFVGLELEADGGKTEPRKAYAAFIQLLLKLKLGSLSASLADRPVEMPFGRDQAAGAPPPPPPPLLAAAAFLAPFLYIPPAGSSAAAAWSCRPP